MVRWLRAAGEPSRLRLLALCAEGELSVSDLAHALAAERAARVPAPEDSVRGGTARATAPGSVGALPARAGRGRGQLRAADCSRRSTAATRSCVRDRCGGARRRGVVPRGGGARANRASGGRWRGVPRAERFRAPRRAALAGRCCASGAARERRCCAQSCTALAPSRRAAQAAQRLRRARGFDCRVLAAARRGRFGERRARPRRRSLRCADPGSPPAASEEPLARTLARARPRVWRPTGGCGSSKATSRSRPRAQRIVEHPLARLRRLLARGAACAASA